MLKGSFIQYFRKFSEKLTLLNPWNAHLPCTYQGIRNVSFSETFCKHTKMNDPEGASNVKNKLYVGLLSIFFNEAYVKLDFSLYFYYIVKILNHLNNLGCLFKFTFETSNWINSPTTPCPTVQLGRSCYKQILSKKNVSYIKLSDKVGTVWMVLK